MENAVYRAHLLAPQQQTSFEDLLITRQIEQSDYEQNVDERIRGVEEWIQSIPAYTHHSVEYNRDVKGTGFKEKHNIHRGAKAQLVQDVVAMKAFLTSISLY